MGNQIRHHGVLQKKCDFWAPISLPSLGSVSCRIFSRAFTLMSKWTDLQEPIELRWNRDWMSKIYGLCTPELQGKGSDYIVMEPDLPTGFGGCPGKALSKCKKLVAEILGSVHLLELWLEARYTCLDIRHQLFILFHHPQLQCLDGSESVNHSVWSNSLL